MNVLFLISDQHQAGLMGCEGHAQAITPNLDRLSAQGMRLTQAYCQNPICTPSRVSFLSGQYPHNHGYYGLSGPTPAALPNFLGHFRERGYLTAGIGKLHLPDNPRDWIAGDVDLYANCYRSIDGRPGVSPYFDELESLGLKHLEDSRMMPELAGHLLAHDSRPSNLPLENCVESWCARQAISFMDAAKSEGKPFCMEVAFPRPHHQLTPDRTFWDMYPEDIALPATLNADSAHRPPHFQRQVQALRSHDWVFEPRKFQDGCRRIWRGYLACISQVDWAVGLILDHLASVGMDQDTIVVYSADHGAYHGEYGIPEKAPGICSEAVCRIPMIWRVPGVTAPGSTTAHLVESVDLASTLPALCGLPPMVTTDGKDITDLLGGGGQPVHEVAVTENPWSKAIRWKNWRLVHYPSGLFGADEWCELYDLDDDPLEARNLSLRTEYEPVVAEGRRRLLDWIIQTSRTVTIHPSFGDKEPGRHRYDTAPDGRESNKAGVRLRLAHSKLDYL